ncbi:MAG: ABC transporter ATP-binding protein [Phycisphaerales bacterium]|jgi:iron complex transport system ATP-binding protein
MKLEFQDAHFDYPGRPVLAGVSAVFEPGHLTAILGPNGAGKTTMLRLALGLLAPTRGTVTLAGRATHALSPGDRAASLVYVPQRADVAFAFTAREIVTLGLYAQRLPGPVQRRRVDEALTKADIADRADDVFGALSAGQQQRVTLARALAQVGGGGDPRCVLADEPVSAMDPAHVLRAMRLLTEISKSHVVGVVLHDLPLVLQCASRVVLMGPAGKVVAAGPTLEAITESTLHAAFGIAFRAIPDPANPGQPVTFVSRDTLVA